MDNRFALFALDGSRVFGAKVAASLQMPLGLHEEREFEDGEHKIRPLASVRGQDVYVIHTLCGDAERSGNDKLCRLLFFIGALKDAGAARVTAVTPYLAYARKDQKSQPRDPVTTRYVAMMFEAVGTDVVATMDVHNLAAFQNAFRCHTEHLTANKLLVEYFASRLGSEEIVVVSPDAGGIKRAERFRKALSRALGKPMGAAFAEKHRSEGVVSGDMLVGEVDGRQAIIIDDMISTGTTIVRAARACRERGALRVFAAATHGLFRGNADAVLVDEALERIVVTDTVLPPTLSERVKAKMAVVGSAGFFAEALRRMHLNESVTEWLES